MPMTPERQRELRQAWNESGYEDLGIGFGKPSGDVLALRLVDEMLSTCPNCGRGLDAFQMCLDTLPEDAVRGIRFCRQGQSETHPISCSCARCHNTRKITN